MTTCDPIHFDSLERRSTPFFVHPGHELRIFHWLTGARPVVSILTDGSGAHGSSRLDESRQLLGALRAGIGPTFGRFSDRDLYRTILDRQIEALEPVLEDFTATMIAAAADAVVTHAAEGFNPSHDL